MLKEKEKPPGPAATVGLIKIHQDGFLCPMSGSILFKQAILTVQKQF